LGGKEKAMLFRVAGGKSERQAAGEVGPFPWVVWPVAESEEKKERRRKKKKKREGMRRKHEMEQLCREYYKRMRPLARIT
jgi:hypothetical protein